MNLILFDDPSLRTELLPLTWTRPISEIRVGILTLTEKWERYIQCSASFFTQDYLTEKYPTHISNDNLWINGAICPDETLVRSIKKLTQNSYLVKQGTLIAARNGRASYSQHDSDIQIEYGNEMTVIDHCAKILHYTGTQIRADYTLITKGRKSAPVNDPHTMVYGKKDKNLFIEEGATIKAAVLNVEHGPIYLGKNTWVEEGALIRGPFALCEGSRISMGARIRGDSTIGPYSKIGGEISNAVILGYSNKAHEGFLGNSIIGSWCNLGSGTTTSNLKNNYGDVKIWHYTKKDFIRTGLQFCGLIMGDHNKCGIHTMFNTGTVVGVGSNLFGAGFPPRHIPSFAWGGASGMTTFQLEKMVEVTSKVMERRLKKLNETEENILRKVFELSSEERTWEK